MKIFHLSLFQKKTLKSFQKMKYKIKDFVSEKNLKKMSFLVYQKQIPEFLLKYKRFISCCSATTVNQSYFDLRTFFRYINIMFHSNENIKNISVEDFKHISISDITITDINNVKSSIIIDFIFFASNVLNNCSKTINRKLTSIKSLFEYLYTNNLISSNPSKGIESASIEKRIPKYLTLDESKRMLSNTITSDSQNKIRNYAITCIFLNCSLRVSELIGINISDIKFDEQTLRILGNGNRERIIFLNEATKEAITEYMKVRSNLQKDNKDYDALFISKQYKRISHRSVQEIIENELDSTFNDKEAGLHTHSLRHTCATYFITILYRSGIDIKAIQELLGHTKVEITEIYTHLYDEEVFDVTQNHLLSKKCCGIL